jgi:hypothetical protein
MNPAGGGGSTKLDTVWMTRSGSAVSATDTSMRRKFATCVSETSTV